MPTFTNGFTVEGASRVFLEFGVQAPNYSPFGEVTFDAGDQSWGYGKLNTTNLPTPQAYSYSVDTTNQTINFGQNSSAFDIVLPDNAFSIDITGVQILKTDNTIVAEIPTSSTAAFIYDGEFTILSGSAIDFGTQVSFYAK